MTINMINLLQHFKRGFVILSAVALGSISVTANASAAVSAHGPNIRLRHGTSSNWSGYAAYGANGSFNSVSANWQQPAVSCTSQNAYSSYWVGLDGYNSSTVEQLGTEADCSGGTPSYSAWYEMYPKRSFSVGVVIHAGDNMAASVTYGGGNSYTLNLTDLTTGKSFSTSQKGGSARRTSAEVVVEAPWSGGTLPLANFASANFSNALANGSALGSFSSLDPITMVNPYGMHSTPSSFDSTKRNFSLTWSAQ